MQRAGSCLRTGIRQRYSKPGANTKHLNVKSVISIPKSLNIEIRSSVQQRPIFTLIYHSCPCTQGLITPYMVNKPLTCSRQYNVHTKTMYLLYSSSSESVFVPYNNPGWKYTLNSLEKETERPAFWIFLTLAAVWKGRERLLYAESFFPTSVCQCDIHLLEAVLHKQTTPKATTGWLNNHRLFSLFSTIAHCKFLVGPQHALLRLFNKQPTRTDNFTL